MYNWTIEQDYYNYYHAFLEYYSIKAKYEINGKFSEEVTEERDLDVMIDNDLKCCSQVHCIENCW